MCTQALDHRFACLGRPQTVWAVSAIHAEHERLHHIHDAIAAQIQPGDRIVYLGNYTGFGRHAGETIDELLAFRRLVLAQPGMVAQDIVYLRGAQEEMWQQLMQLQFCQNPVDTLLWMLGNGMTNTMESYGVSPHDGIEAAREGTMFLTRWTNAIRSQVRKHAGHDVFACQHKRAAYVYDGHRYPALFVNAGLSYHRKLTEQDDAFWWDADGFEQVSGPYDPFEKVIRGFDPRHQGVRLNCVTASLDGGSGFGGPLVCARVEQDGNISELMEA